MNWCTLDAEMNEYTDTNLITRPMLVHQEAIATHNVLIQVPGDGTVNFLGDIPCDTAVNSWVGVAPDPCLYEKRA
jgi:hypothetical protein